ncbi:MAG: glycerate-2-kinase family protein, partial [Ferruginibacter sp.]
MTTRDNVIQIFNAAVESVQPRHLLPAYLFIDQGSLHILDRQFDINSLPGIFVIGAGKAVAAMAAATENIIDNLMTEGLVVTKYDHSIPLKKTKCLEAAHPVPDENSLAATEATIQLLKTVCKGDIVICLISGGASSLWADLPAGSSLPGLQDVFTLLLKSGADIKEVNAVRKHLSVVKGGQLLRYAPDANWFTFIISDVPGDQLDVIASG